MALPDKHQLKFNIHKDAKSLMEAIEKRFGGNKETKKVQKTLLKQQYENFSDNEDLKQIDLDDLEEMDLKWQMAMLTIRARSFQADEEPTNYTLMAYASLGSSNSSGSDNETSSKNPSKLLESQVSDKTSLGFDSQVFDRQMFDCEELHSYESDNNVPKSPENDRYKISKGYHVVPPPYTRTFMHPKPDLVFNDAPNASQTVANVINFKSSLNKPSKDMSKTLRSDAPIIEDWIFDFENETENEFVPKQKEPSFVIISEHVKTPMESVKKAELPKQAENLRTNNQNSRGHKKN
uniref:Ribonuclease H-like domain-containing protein n=1 Tax=Tanacetum cinerariifolium TaxID=118510 RepID=A0A6L2JQF9_TANCI|nr:ribonuclease H-like domain-containing protein [Tanacetum cinerariifolium]